MTKKSVATWGIVIVLLVSLFGTAAAQTGTTPGETPTVTPTAGAKFFTHPVVKLLSTYFDRDTETTEPAVTATPDPNAVPDPSATPEVTESESGLGPIGEEIAAYHEEGMGFGVLVKIYAMAEAAKAACAEQTATQPAADGSTTGTTDGTTTGTTCTPVTADELVTAFKSGSGMGQLFKEYGKPAMLGVGHVKHAAEQLESQDGTQVTGDEETVTTDDTAKGNNGNGQANKQGKDKQQKKDKGPKK